MDLPRDASLEGRYDLLGHIAKGGFADVYRVCHVQLGTIHALKVINTRSEVVRKRLLEEGRLQARLRHPNLVRVTDVVDVEGQPGLVMDYVAGPTLQDLLSERRLQLFEAIELAGRIIEGTAAAHDIGLVHRDLKPANILLEPSGDGWNPRVTDFGLAKALGGEEADGITRQGVAMGTPGYMAPEQFRDAASVDQRADVFALGAVLYRMVTGERPFTSKHVPELLIAAELSQFRPVQALAPGLPAGLAAVITTCLAPRAADRYLDARDLARAWASGATQRLPDSLGGAPVHAGAHADSRAESKRVAAAADTQDLGTIGTAPAPPELAAAPRPVTFDHSGSSSRSLQEPVGLPAAMGDFIGRADAMASLDRLAAGGSRIVTVLATAGVGKTRLAAHYARTRGGMFRGGVLFCDLNTARTPEDVVAALGLCLEVQLVEGNGVHRVAEVLRARGRALVVLDNFEQLPREGGEVVDRLAREAPEAVFLVTSRQALQLGSEVVLRLGPLEPPQGDSVDEVRDSEAGALFLSRARAVRGSFELNATNAADIAAILRELDGLPLAIELAASRLRALRPKQIRERLSDRFRLLQGRGAERGATLRGAIEWSWDLLDGHEQAALVQCAVFSGSFGSEAADDVVDLLGWIDAPWTLDVLEALLDKCLLRPIESKHGLRLGQYSSIRAFALAKLEEDGAVTDPQGEPASGPAFADEVRQRHARHYAQIEPQDGLPESLWGAGGDARYDELDAERGNLLAAFDYAAGAEDWETAGEIAIIYCSIALIGGPFDGAMAMMEQVAAHPVSVELDWRLHWLIAGVAPALGRTREGHAAAERALATAREQGWHKREAATLREWGNCLSVIEGPVAARQAYLDGLALLEGERVPFYEAMLCYNLAEDALRRGDVDEGVGWASRSLAAADAGGLKVLEVTAHTQLGAIARIRGDFAAARSHLEAALRVGEASRNRQWEVEAKPEYARVLTDVGDLDSARVVLSDAIAAAIAIGDTHDATRIRWQLARTELRAGRDDVAADLAAQLEDEWRRAGVGSARVYARLTSALLHLRHRRTSAALVATSQAVEAARATGDADLLGTALALNSRALRQGGRLEEAEESLSLGSELDVGAAVQAQLSLELGGLDLHRGDGSSAGEHGRRAEEAARSIGDFQQLSEALLVIAEASGDDGASTKEALDTLQDILEANPASVHHSLGERLKSLRASAGSEA